jgi:hypothetical protein
MNPRVRIRIVVTLAVVTVALVVVAWFALRSRNELEMRLSAASAQRAKLQTDLERARGAADTATKAASLAAKPVAPPPVEMPKPAAFPARTRAPGLLDLARDNPQLWNEFIASKRAELGQLYLPLAQRLHLTAEQREKLKDVFAADIARGSDIGAAAHAQGVSHDDPAIRALREQSAAQRRADLEALLGPTGYREFDRYDRAIPVRGYVDGLAVELAATAPLSSQQADLLERALAETNEAYRNGKQADPGEVDWEAVDRRAREILTPQQFAVWQQGFAHNMFGGSRHDQELKKVYLKVVERAKDSAAAK